ncbi:uncharacterized protein LOC134719573 [Mytilus trossulus]|uniref:uncharacterized protein LOC134719573 n=1 Tax=Mytilus trossulus TaxID=6551 RepID=UPI003007B6D4
MFIKYILIHLSLLYRTEEENGKGDSDSDRDIRGIRVITTRISLNEAEYLNIGSTISIINKKLMSADVKIKYFQQSLKVLQTQMLKDVRFNELLDQRKQELVKHHESLMLLVTQLAPE